MGEMECLRQEEVFITEDELINLQEEGAISAAENGADREYDYDHESYLFNFVSEQLGTENWYIRS